MDIYSDEWVAQRAAEILPSLDPADAALAVRLALTGDSPTLDRLLALARDAGVMVTADEAQTAYAAYLDALEDGEVRQGESYPLPEATPETLAVKPRIDGERGLEVPQRRRRRLMNVIGGWDETTYGRYETEYLRQHADHLLGVHTGDDAMRLLGTDDVAWQYLTEAQMPSGRWPTVRTRVRRDTKRDTVTRRTLTADGTPETVTVAHLANTCDGRRITGHGAWVSYGRTQAQRRAKRQARLAARIPVTPTTIEREAATLAASLAPGEARTLVVAGRATARIARLKTGRLTLTVSTLDPALPVRTNRGTSAPRFSTTLAKPTMLGAVAARAIA